MRYHIYTYEDIKKPKLTVPWFWLAHLTVAIFKNDWLKGSVVDSITGQTRITWELSGNILGDGKAHLTVDGVAKGPGQVSPDKMSHLLAAMADKDE